jgi:hypothetical protein
MYMCIYIHFLMSRSLKYVCLSVCSRVARIVTLDGGVVAENSGAGLYEDNMGGRIGRQDSEPDMQIEWEKRVALVNTIESKILSLGLSQAKVCFPTLFTCLSAKTTLSLVLSQIDMCFPTSFLCWLDGRGPTRGGKVSWMVEKQTCHLTCDGQGCVSCRASVFPM